MLNDNVLEEKEKKEELNVLVEIAERIRKTGKRKGQLDYDLKLANKETLQARKEDLPYIEICDLNL
ncbi:13228_t:CDS:2, partial [Entrophospora sp. SA101]